MELKRCKAVVVWKDEEEDTKMELKRCKTAEQFNSMELQRCKIAEKFNSMDLKRCKAEVVPKEDTKMESESEAEAWLSVAPDDILVQILMRLPNSKDALQCKLVSKHWNSVISNPSFLRQGAAFHRHNYTNTVEGDYSFSLIFQLEQCLPSKSKSIKNPVFALEQSKGGGNNQNNACVRPLYLHRLLIGNSSSSSSSLSLSEWELKIGASCDDLLLVEYKRKKKNKEFKYYVVNLQTHEWIDLPPPPATALAPPTLEDNTLLGTYFKVGLLCHYDYSAPSASFKVIRIRYLPTTIVDIHQSFPMSDVDRSYFSVHIYSSDSKKWGEYIVDWYPFRLTHYLTRTPIISHNGMFHWVNGRALLSLNPFDLVFDDDLVRLRLNRTVELPEKNFHNDPEINHFYDFRSHGKVSSFLGIGVVRDHLRVITMHIDGYDGQRPLLVWQLDESKIGAADANGPWTLVYNVSTSEFPLKKLSFSFHFMACHPYEGDVLFLEILNSIYQINLRTLILTKAKQDKPYKANYILSYVLPPLLHQWLPSQLTCFL